MTHDYYVYDSSMALGAEYGEMVDIVARLAEDFVFVRVDFFVLENQ